MMSEILETHLSTSLFAEFLMQDEGDWGEVFQRKHSFIAVPVWLDSLVEMVLQKKSHLIKELKQCNLQAEPESKNVVRLEGKEWRKQDNRHEDKWIKERKQQDKNENEEFIY